MSEKPAPFVIQVSKGILRDRQVRRTVLFWLVAAALGLLGVGAVVLDGYLSQHVVLFLLYWGACLWLTATSLLLALYDLLAVRTEARAERQRLTKRVLGENPEDHVL